MAWDTLSAAGISISQSYLERAFHDTEQSCIFVFQLGCEVLTHPKPRTLYLETLRMGMTSEEGLVKRPDFLEFSFFRGSVVCVLSFQSND